MAETNTEKPVRASKMKPWKHRIIIYCEQVDKTLAQELKASPNVVAIFEKIKEDTPTN